jgi:hypothetical protein
VGEPRGPVATFDVYAHYLAYEAFRRLYIGRMDLEFGVGTVRRSCRIYLPGDEIPACARAGVPVEGLGKHRIAVDLQPH